MVRSQIAEAFGFSGKRFAVGVKDFWRWKLNIFSFVFFLTPFGVTHAGEVCFRLFMARTKWPQRKGAADFLTKTQLQRFRIRAILNNAFHRYDVMTPVIGTTFYGAPLSCGAERGDELAGGNVVFRKKNWIRVMQWPGKRGIEPSAANHVLLSEVLNEAASKKRKTNLAKSKKKKNRSRQLRSELCHLHDGDLSRQ